MAIPKKVTIVEVGPRDGFQNIKETIPTERKLAIIFAMLQAGIRHMEITSFVNPKWIPQLADAALVAEAVLKTVPEDFRAIALVPNIRGASNAVSAGIRQVSYVFSASESHNRRNVNRSVEESLQELQKIRDSFPELGIRVSLSTSFGCPFEGEISVGKVVELLRKIEEIGIREVILCDTIGIANPLQVKRMLRTIRREALDLELGLHFHDTRGLGLSNIYAGLLEGVNVFETSIGGLGGCPFAPGSAGNTATEDLLNMLQGIGVEHGIHMDAYMEAVALLKTEVKVPLTGRMASMCRQAAGRTEEG